MKSRNLATALLGFVLVVSACGKKDPPKVTPTGVQVTTPPAQPAGPPAPTTTNNPTTTGPTTNPEDGKTAALIAIADKIHFEYDKSDISSADAGRLDLKARILRANPVLKIRIVGHCDERGSDSYNIALGMRRALAAKEYLVRAGANAANIEITSLGRESPVDRGGNEDAWSKNRRDEFEATSGTQTIVMPR